jgi:hypothetical protein
MIRSVMREVLEISYMRLCIEILRKNDESGLFNDFINIAFKILSISS